MRFPLLIAVMLLGLPATSSHALTTCFECRLGVYDDPQLTRASGTAGLFEVKSLYVGIRLPEGIRIRTLSFTADYPEGFSVIDWTSYVSGVRVTPAGNGVRVEWPSCIAGTRLLFRVRVFGMGFFPNAELQLLDATAGDCDGGDDWRVPADCYLLNPVGSSAACGMAVLPRTWSLVKELFR